MMVIKSSEITQLLVDKGVNVNAKSKDNTTALFLAASLGYSNSIDILTRAGADLEVKQKTSGMTALMFAAKLGNIPCINSLIEAGSIINAQDNYGATALLKGSSHKEVVNRLLESGADVNIKAQNGLTALQCSNNIETIELMLKAGANINEQGKYETFLNNWIHNGVDDLKWLIKQGADINLKAKSGYTPLERTASLGYFDVVKYLIEKGAKVNSRKGSFSPLMGAVTGVNNELSAQHIRCVKILIENGADINAKHQDKTALDLVLDNIRMAKKDNKNTKLLEEFITLLKGE